MSMFTFSPGCSFTEALARLLKKRESWRRAGPRWWCDGGGGWEEALCFSVYLSAEEEKLQCFILEWPRNKESSDSDNHLQFKEKQRAEEVSSQHNSSSNTAFVFHRQATLMKHSSPSAAGRSVHFLRRNVRIWTDRRLLKYRKYNVGQRSGTLNLNMMQHAFLSRIILSKWKYTFQNKQRQSQLPLGRGQRSLNVSGVFHFKLNNHE